MTPLPSAPSAAPPATAVSVNVDGRAVSSVTVPVACVAVLVSVTVVAAGGDGRDAAGMLVDVDLSLRGGGR